MKKITHILAACLVAFSCLAFPQETKSEPLTAVILGVVWTYAIPAGLTGLTGYAAWLKAKEYVYNKQAQANGEAIAENKKKINQIQESVNEVRIDLSSMANQTKEQHQSVLRSIGESNAKSENRFDVFEREQNQKLQDFKSLLEQGISREEMQRIVEEAERRSRKGFSGLGNQFTALQGQLAEDRNRFGQQQEEISGQLKAIQEQQKKYSEQQREQTAHLQLIATSLSRIQQQGIVALPPQSPIAGQGSSCAGQALLTMRDSKISSATNTDLLS